MPVDAHEPRRLRIKKYSNRRFYDATRSRHVTLSEMHALVRQRYVLTIIDSKSGDDITNAVLLHIMLERDPGRLSAFPSGLLHALMRAEPRRLDEVLDRYFRQAYSDAVRHPPGDAASQQPRTANASQPRRTPDPQEEIETLRRQLAALSRRLEEVSAAASTEN